MIYLLFAAVKKSLGSCLCVYGVWFRGRINGGGCDINALGLLPDKLKTELALHVNLETLKKVYLTTFCR